jgi:hypothetical protein
MTKYKAPKPKAPVYAGGVTKPVGNKRLAPGVHAGKHTPVKSKKRVPNIGVRSGK